MNLSPGKLDALLKQAVALHKAGRLDEAEKLYAQARRLAPKSAELLLNSGLLAYQQGRLPEAIDLLTRSLQLAPNSVVCEMRLALALLAAGRAPEAEQRLRHVVSVQPTYHVAWDNLATCLKSQDRLKEAIQCHEKVVTLNPSYAHGWFSYGLTLSLLGRSAEALERHDRALAADANHPMAHFGRAQALQQLHRPQEAIEAYGRFLALKPDHHEARSFRLFCLHYLEEISREQLFDEHLAYGKAIGPERPVALPNVRDPRRRLRVAILSPDLRQHACSYFLEPLLQHLPANEFELYLYHDHFREDAVSERLRRHAAVWRNFVSQPALVVERAIREDAPDILIDLAGHTGMTNRLPLFARRLAPVQITYLGYPDTTGVPAIDYRFTDSIADPDGEADRFATEELVRSSSCAWTYAPPLDAPPVRTTAREPGAPVVFGSFNNLAKITDRQLSVWGKILSAVPNSRLLLKGAGLSDAAKRSHYRERAARAGIAPERIELLERTPDTVSHLSIYHRVDVALDTFPYNGTTTTCEALWMGVPVVTLAGEAHMTRVGASLLTAVGRPEWIAHSENEYIATAVKLATAPRDPAECHVIRDTLKNSVICAHAEQGRRFGAALRECWVRWCENGTGRAAAA